jgi:hypothetical protein
MRLSNTEQNNITCELDHFTGSEGLHCCTWEQYILHNTLQEQQQYLDT